MCLLCVWVCENVFIEKCVCVCVCVCVTDYLLEQMGFVQAWEGDWKPLPHLFYQDTHTHTHTHTHTDQKILLVRVF